MHYPLSTGESARLIGTTEPRLADVVRRGRVIPPPVVFAGRRLWTREHLLQAAHVLGILTEELRRRLTAQEVEHDS